MTISRRFADHRLLLACIAIVLCLAGCGSDPSDADRVSLSYSESPINELLGVDIALRGGDLVGLEASAEERVAECMRAAGFDYIPVDFTQFDPTGGASTDTREWAEVNGYGATVRPEIPEPDAGEFDDPNAAIRNQLSTNELTAYQQALYGEAPAEDEEVALEDQTGCVANAYQTVIEARQDLSEVEAFYTDYADQLNALDERFRADPRFLELEGRWATCMAEAGFEVDSRAEIFVELNRRMSEVTPLLVPGEEPSTEAQAAMDAVSDWERLAAVTDWDCEQPVQEELRKLRYGYEALFLEENEL